jgi:hypothetical protein
MRHVIVGLALAGVFASIDLPASSQTTQKLDYEQFCKLPDVEAKRAAFLAASPQNRADLVRTQIERWRDANRARLNAKQLAALADLIAAIGPDLYSEGPKAEEQRVKARALAEVQRDLFTPEEIQAMQPNGPCIAKAK